MSKLEIDISQFMLDTMGLDPVAVGAYVRLLVAYRHGGPIANDARVLSKMAGLDAEDWDMRSLQLAELFQIQGGFWHNATLDAQIEKKAKLRGNAAKASAAAAGARATEIPADKVTPEIIHDMASKAFAVPEPDPLGTEIDLKFMPDGSFIVMAKTEGFSTEEISNVLDSFKRYHHAAGSLSTNWNESWSKWWERNKPARAPKAKPRVQVSNKAPAPEEEDEDAEA